MRATLTALAVLAAAPASAQTCFPFDELNAALTENYSERMMIIANDQDGGSYFFYGNPDTETWTIVVYKSGCAFVLAEGLAYDQMAIFPGDLL